MASKVQEVEQAVGEAQEAANRHHATSSTSLTLSANPSQTSLAGRGGDVASEQPPAAGGTTTTGPDANAAKLGDVYMSLGLDERQEVAAAVKGVVEAVVKLEAERLVWREDEEVMRTAAAEALAEMSPAERELEGMRKEREIKARERLDQMSANDRRGRVEEEAKGVREEAKRR